MIRKIIFFVLFGFVVSACSDQSNSDVDSAAIVENSVMVESEAVTFDDVYAAAKAALDEAEAQRNVWSKTEILLNASMTANGEGRVADAINLATEAKKQAELATAQALTEKEVWRSRVLPE